MAFSQKIVDLKKEVLAESQELFAHVDAIAEENTLKVLDAMRECKVSDAHFNTTSGYAYDAIGRSKLEELYAKIFGAERALVRTQFVSGTHALATVLFGILRPGDELVSLTGKPYDTMQTVIGYDNPSPGSLKEFGVLYNELSMIDGKVDMDGIKNVITDKTNTINKSVTAPADGILMVLLKAVLAVLGVALIDIPRFVYYFVRGKLDELDDTLIEDIINNDYKVELSPDIYVNEEGIIKVGGTITVDGDAEVTIPEIVI